MSNFNQTSEVGSVSRRTMLCMGMLAGANALPMFAGATQAAEPASPVLDPKPAQRTLGSGTQAMTVSAVGFGCMGLNYHRGPHPDRKQLIRLLHEAVDRGVTLFDTAESYGPWTNEELVGEALHPYRHRVNITTKFGHTFVNGKHNIGVEDARPEHIREVCEASLKRLNIEAIAMFYQHRQDKNVPVEDVAGTVADLIKEGKVLRFGLSECSAETVRRAHKVCPVTAVQSEYHIMWREPETRLFPTLKELGIGFVAYSPVLRGFLGGGINECTQFVSENDNRATHPQFTPEALRANMPIVEELQKFGRTRGMTAAQVALAWMLAKGPWLVPIPGTTKSAHLIEDLQTAAYSYSQQEWSALEKAVASHAITGGRANARDTSIQS